MEEIGHQGSMDGHARVDRTNRGRFQIKKAGGRETDENDFIPEGLSRVNRLAALLKGQEGLNDIERGEPWKVAGTAIKTEQEISLIIQGNVYSLHLEAIPFYNHWIIPRKMLKYGHAQGGNPMTAVGKDRGKTAVDTVGGWGDSYIAKAVDTSSKYLNRGLRGNVRRSGLTRLILQGQRDAI